MFAGNFLEKGMIQTCILHRYTFHMTIVEIFIDSNYFNGPKNFCDPGLNMQKKEFLYKEK